jgi:hypothetical protein
MLTLSNAIRRHKPVKGSIIKELAKSRGMISRIPKYVKLS